VGAQRNRLRRQFQLIVYAVLVLIVTDNAALSQTRVCNTGNAEIFYAKAYDTPIPQVHGWYRFPPDACIRDSGFGYYLLFRQVNSAGQTFYVDYGVNDPPYAYHTGRRFCVKAVGSFTYNVNQGRSCPPDLKFAEFSLYVPLRRGDGLISALTRRVRIPSRTNMVPEPAIAPQSKAVPKPSAPVKPKPGASTQKQPEPKAGGPNSTWIWILATIMLVLGGFGIRLLGRQNSAVISTPSRALRYAMHAGKGIGATVRRQVTKRSMVLAAFLILVQLTGIAIVYTLKWYPPGTLLVLIGTLLVAGGAAGMLSGWVEGHGRILLAILFSSIWAIALPLFDESDRFINYTIALLIYAVLVFIMLAGYSIVIVVKYARRNRHLSLPID